MVQRNYQAPQFQTQDRRVVQEQQVAAADTRPNYERNVGDGQWRDRLFANIGNQAANALNKMADIEFSNLYLEGQASVGVVKSEEELQGNPLTRDWKVAGYRDTMGKLALADLQATFMQDLVSLREKNPEDLQAYLAERRQKLLPALAGMSREARATMAGQMLLQDRDATARWTGEHAKFIIEQKHQAISTQANTMLRGVFAAQSLARAGEIQPENLTETLRAASGVMVGSMWEDASLPRELKQQLTFETVQNALTQGGVEFYDYLRDTAIPDQLLGGKASTASTLISRLTPEQQQKLATAYVEANQKTKAARGHLALETVANIQAQIDAGQYTGTFDTLKSQLLPILAADNISGDTYRSMLNSFADKQYKGQMATGLAEAGVRGDIQYAYSLGKGPEDMIKAMEQTYGKLGMTSAQQMMSFATAGDNGLPGAYKKVGEYLGATLSQVIGSKDGTVLPQHMANLRAIFDRMEKSEKAGNTTTRTETLAGLGEDQRIFAERVYRATRSTQDGGNGDTLDYAIAWARDLQEKETALTPAARAAKASNQAAEANKAIDGLESRGLIGSLWLGAKALFSSNAQVEQKLLPADAVYKSQTWFGSSPTVQFYSEQARGALRDEFNHVSLLRPFATQDEILTVAKANVAGRTITVGQFPLFMPRGVDLQQTFGVGPGNQAAIGKALDGILQSTVKDSRWQMLYSQGRLYAQEIDKDGARVGNGMFISPDQVKTRIAEDTAKESKAANERFGSGKTVQMDNLSVKYSGWNNAGVQNDWMLDFRDNLVKNEGVRSVVYKDSVGRNTVGVGVAEGNPNYPKPGPDGKITSEQASASFVGATEDAARAGASIAKRVGVDNKAGFMLMSELAYHSGTNFLFRKDGPGDENRAFVRAVRAGDPLAAVEAFKGTAAYRVSGDTRREHYVALIHQAMRTPLRASGVVTE